MLFGTTSPCGPRNGGVLPVRRMSASPPSASMDALAWPLFERLVRDEQEDADCDERDRRGVAESDDDAREQQHDGGHPQADVGERAEVSVARVGVRASVVFRL